MEIYVNVNDRVDEKEVGMKGEEEMAAEEKEEEYFVSSSMWLGVRLQGR